MKNILWLLVFVLDTVKPSTGDVYFAKVSEKVILDCGVDTVTTSVSWFCKNDLVWRLDKKGIGGARKGQTALGSRLRAETQLEIFKVKGEYAGMFKCIADGAEYRHTLVVVSVSVNPAEPELNGKASLYCNVDGLNEGATVQWKSPDGSTHEKIFHIDSVAPSHKGDWFCQVAQDGKTHEVKLNVVVKDPPPPPTTTSSPTKNSKNDPNSACLTCATATEQFDWWVWVAIGVGCLVVIILIILVIVLCRRNKRRKKKIQRMKNGRLRPKNYCQCNNYTAVARPQQGRRKQKPSALPV